MVRRALLSALGDVDIRLLRVFVAVSESHGFTAAELELNIGKSTISKHISDLEHRLGLKLCNRGPSGFSMTPEGGQVLDLTKDLLARIDDFQARVDDIHMTLTGTFRLGIFDQSSTNPQAQVHQAIRKFDETAPNVSLKISLDTPSALESAVTDGSVDMAIVPLYRPSSVLVYLPLYREKMTLYCGEGHPLFGETAQAIPQDVDLSAYKYAGYSFNSPNMMAGRRLGLRRAAQAKEEEALALLIQSGRYLGYLADHVAANYGTKAAVWPVFPEDTSYAIDYGAATRKKPGADRKTNAMLKCLKDAHTTLPKPQP